MPLPSFTITGNVFDLLGDVAASEIVGNGLRAPGTPARVTFTSNVPTNSLITFDGDMYRVNEVVATVGRDGAILRNGQTVRLLANDAGLNIEGLQWRVSIGGMRLVTFDAPADGGVVDLATVTPAPSVAVIGIPNIPDGGEMVGDNYQFTVGGNPLGDPVVLPSGGGGVGVTNLAATLSSSQVIVTSDTGTDATIPAVDATNAGVMTPTMKTKLDGISGTNTGDQTSIVGITGTTAQFNTANTGADFYTTGGADVAVADGGTGVSTLTGIVKGNGTSAFSAATAGTDYVAPGGALGTPSSGTLTNCTGLPVAGIAATVVAAGSDAAAARATINAAQKGVQWDALTSSVTNLPRYATNSTQAISNQALWLMYFTAEKSVTASSLTALTSSPAQAGATLVRMGLYSVDGSDNLTLIGSTANDTNLFNTTFASHTKSMSATANITEGSRYAIGILVVGASTSPTMTAAASTATETALAPRIVGTVSSQSDLPSSITAASVGNSGKIPLRSGDDIMLPAKRNPERNG